VNAQHPVNASGEWHVSHAFGDFCEFCHAGNVQAVEKDAAHKGMIYPLSDPQGSCASCHPKDFSDKAQIYAKQLGANIGAKPNTTSGGTTSAESSKPAVTNVESKPIPAPGENKASGALIDYNRRYEIEVLGITDTSQLGNLILALIGLSLLVVGFGLVWRFEKLGEAWRKARAVPEDDWRRLAYSGAYDVHGPVLPSHPATAVQSQPVMRRPFVTPGVEIAAAEKLDSQTQAALGRLLTDPVHGAAIIQALARLDPALIQGLQSLAKKDRDLLLAVVEQLGKDA
jgi:hypothetical protein